MKVKIGAMVSYKATVKYGGRNWIAWFDPKIPVQDGTLFIMVIQCSI